MKHGFFNYLLLISKNMMEMYVIKKLTLYYNNNYQKKSVIIFGFLYAVILSTKAINLNHKCICRWYKNKYLWAKSYAGRRASIEIHQ